MSTPTLGLFVPMVAKADQASNVEQLLLTAQSMLTTTAPEPLMLQWYGIKYTSGASAPTYAIFDTFAAEEGRQAHLGGAVAAAALGSADKLLAEAPDVAGAPFVVLASVVRWDAGKAGEVKKGLEVGLRVVIQAKSDQVDAVREFLKGAVPLVEAEPETLAWYAVEWPGTGKFGIVDFFPGKAGLDAHLNGKVAAALFANADAMLTQAPDVVTTEVIATV